MRWSGYYSFNQKTNSNESVGSKRDASDDDS